MTVDAPVLEHRLGERRNKFELPPHLSLPKMPAGGGRSHHYSGHDASSSWDTTIPWIKANTILEIWLKGSACSPEIYIYRTANTHQSTVQMMP
jgi:(S)-2-hydroxy-acid oxidase